MPRPVRALAITALAAALGAVLLTGCSSTYTDQQRDGGVTPAAAEATLLSIEGVTAARYGTYPWDSPGEGGAFSSEGMDVVLNITVDPEYSIADPTAFFDFAAATAWSVNDRYPEGSVVIQLTGGEDAAFDWLPVARELFGDRVSFWGPRSEGYTPSDAEWFDEGRTLSLGADNYGDRYGRWPGAAVPVPAGLLRHEPLGGFLPPAISDVQFSLDESADESCYAYSFVRSGDEQVFLGDVIAILNDGEGQKVDSAVLSGADNGYAFCFPRGQQPIEASLQLSTYDFEWKKFAPIDETYTLTG